jgi:AraC-like DNA-binding protein
VSYVEVAPPADLRPFVRAFWWRTREAPAAARTVGAVSEVRVLPDGCADLLIDGDRVRWVGTMTRARVVEERAQGEESPLFGVRFQPGALAAFVRAPLHEVTDEHVPFDALGARFARPVAAEPTFAAHVKPLTQALRQVSPTSSPLLRLTGRLAGQTRVDALLAATGWSARTLERRFLDALGVTPKQHLRYLRFEEALAAVRRGERLAELALAAGYADQAHFSREFRRFVGLSPRAYRDGFVQDRSATGG